MIADIITYYYIIALLRWPLLFSPCYYCLCCLRQLILLMPCYWLLLICHYINIYITTLAITIDYHWLRLHLLTFDYLLPLTWHYLFTLALLCHAEPLLAPCHCAMIFIAITWCIFATTLMLMPFSLHILRCFSLMHYFSFLLRHFLSLMPLFSLLTPLLP